MIQLRRLDAMTLVAGQIAPADVAEAAAQGVTLIVNNRPDGEEPDQPAGAAIEAAAQAAGIDYLFIPVPGGISHREIGAMADAIEQAEGPILAFCRSGTRSTFLWALARAQLGDDPEALTAGAAGAGYDLAPIRGFLERG
jgi:uncharacterized protein (TIGR01244 family)